MDDPQNRLVLTLLREKLCFAMDIDELEMEVQELGNQQEMKHVIPKRRIMSWNVT